jgi:NCS2 family nucleobase:cation symporter-2
VITAGIFGVIAAPFISRLLPLFPPVVTGTIIIVIGLSLMRVAINWAGGGLPTPGQMVDGQIGQFRNPDYGALDGLSIAVFVLVVILAVTKYALPRRDSQAAGPAAGLAARKRLASLEMRPAQRNA